MGRQSSDGSRMARSTGDAGEAMASIAETELRGISGRREALGSIEIRRRKGVTWLIVREDEGLLAAAHRALDLYMAEQGRVRVKVFRKATQEEYVMDGREWDEVLSFRPKA